MACQIAATQLILGVLATGRKDIKIMTIEIIGTTAPAGAWRYLPSRDDEGRGQGAGNRSQTPSLSPVAGRHPVLSPARAGAGDRTQPDQRIEPRERLVDGDKALAAQPAGQGPPTGRRSPVLAFGFLLEDQTSTPDLPAGMIRTCTTRALMTQWRSLRLGIRKVVEAQ